MGRYLEVAPLETDEKVKDTNRILQQVIELFLVEFKLMNMQLAEMTGEEMEVYDIKET